MRKILLLVILSLFSTFSMMAATDIVYMNVGDTRTLSFNAPAYIVGTQWTISDQEALEFSPTPGAMAVRASVKALKARSASDRVIVHCTYYYRELDPSGKYQYQRTGYQDWEVIIKESGSGGGGDSGGSNGTTVSMHYHDFSLDEGQGLSLSAHVNDNEYTGSYKWTSSNPDVLAITDTRGPAVWIKAKSQGSSYLRVTLDNGNYDELKVTVPSKSSDSSILEFTLTDDKTGYSVSAKYTDAKLYGDIIIPSTYNNLPITEIAVRGFYNNDYMTSITIPNTVKKIGEDAFWASRALKSVTIGNSVESIGSFAFAGCKNLTSIIIPESVISIGRAAFSGCKGLISVSIGSSVVSIGEGTFIDCNSLTSIVIPESVISIGNEAFKNCSGLTLVSIGKSVTSIGDKAFESCTSLTNLMIEDGEDVLSLGNNHYNGLFNDCPLKTVYLGRDLEYKTDFASGISPFYGIDTLVNLTISNTVTNLGYYAFYGCSGLTSVTIPNSITSIESDAFSNCPNLVKLYFNAENCELIEKYSSPFSSSLKEIYIGNDVKNIPDDAFRTCSALELISIGESVTSIGSCAFFYCRNLTSVTIPTSVISIGMAAFSGCSSLKTVTLPSSVTTIDSSAFYNCNSLESVYYPTTNPIECNSNIFSDYVKPTLYIPLGSREAFLNTSPWNKFQKIIEVDENGKPVYTDCLFVVGTLNNWNLDDLSYSLNKDEDGRYHGSIFFEKAADHEFILAYKNGDKTSFFHPKEDYGPIVKETSINNSNLTGFETYRTLTTSGWYNITLPSNWPGGLINITVEELDPDNRCDAIFQIERSNMGGIESVVYDVEEDPVFFNLQGVNVGNNASALSSGLYIKRQGSKIEKVIIK